MKPWIKIIICTLLIWFVAYSYFVWKADHYPVQISNCDHIVVLTGDPLRIPFVIKALDHIRPKTMFISGVFETTKIYDILKKAYLLGIYVTLGSRARNTHENAAEIYEWVRSHRIKKIAMITSDYHMYRSLLEVRHKNPKLEVAATAVRSKRNLRFYLNCFKEMHKSVFVLLRNIFEV